MKISTNINKDVEFVLIDNKSLNKRIKELGKEITKDYKGKNPVLLCLLKGSLHFMTKLAENITLPIEYECLKASSYANTVSTGKVSVLVNMLNSIKDKDVIIIEDIVDTGHTMKNILAILEKEGARSIEIATLLNKQARREVEGINPKYVGFEIPDYFVIGFGLDYNEFYRNLPYIGVLKEEVYKNNEQ